MNVRRLKILKAVGPYKPGAVAKVKCNSDGVPFDRFWRRRLEDALTDNCVEWESEPVATKSKKEAK